MDRYAQSKKNLVILKSRLKKLEEKRRIERLRKKAIKRAVIIASLLVAKVIIYFMLY